MIPKNIYVMRNGMIAATDDNGEQILYMQQNTLKQCLEMYFEHVLHVDCSRAEWHLPREMEWMAHYGT